MIAIYKLLSSDETSGSIANWCNEEKQSDVVCVKNYYDRVISENSNERIIHVSHHDSIEIVQLYERLLLLEKTKYQHA